MRWERDLLAFLCRELAPSPARWRATGRLVVACAFSVALVMALHVPDGEFMLVSLFVVSLGNAGASIAKGRLRVTGTLIAGALAIVIIAGCADKPWLLFPLHAIVIGVALFLSRTTTAPYAFLLAGVTFAMVVPAYPADPASAIETGLWRVALTALGVVVGTGAQLFLWPDDPEALLLDDLAQRVADTEALLDRALAWRRGDPPLPVAAGIGPVGVTGQLDLLQNAETRSPWLRQRHTEQIQLIADMQLLVTAARRLARLAGPRELPAWARPRLAAVREACAGVRQALATRTAPPAGIDAAAGAAAEPAGLDAVGLEILAAVEELEAAVASLPTAMGFLAQDATTAAASAPIREPVAERRLFTAESTLANSEAIRFALKVAVATSICVLVMEACDAPGLATSVISCVVVAQSFFGAGLRKGILRLTGATAGGLLALLVIVAVMPNLETLASLLVVSTACFGAAAWLLSGSSRISYVGLQMAIVLALTVINPGAPTTDLVPVRDRVLGILLGIVVMAVVDVALWPVFGRTALRRKLADALTQIAALQRAAASGGLRRARESALGVYRTLGDALAMHDDLQLEASVDDALAAERGALLRVTGDVQRVFLRLLATARHRPSEPPPTMRDALDRLDEATASALAGLGRSLVGEGAIPEVPGLDLTDAAGSNVELAEFAGLSERLLEAVRQLAGNLLALARTTGTLTATTAPSRPSPPRRRPAPQPS